MGIGAARRGARDGKWGRALGVALAVTTAVGGGTLALPGMAVAQGEALTDFAVPAGPLGGALTAFGRQAGLQVSYLSGVVAGHRTRGVSGAVSNEQALASLLAGTGLSYRFNGTGAVTIVGSGTAGGYQADDGSVLLDPITVTAGSQPQTAPYETAGATAYISSQDIERYRGSSPADMFRGTPGVLSGEARNGGGAVDVNIRGMQGMGRVNVTVDGAENALNVYQGYQGVSNRSYVDPDLLEGVDISKGSDVSSRGIAGTVAMRTVDAADIVEDGKSFGVRVKGGFGTNTSSPHAGAVGGYDFPSYYEPAVAAASSDGMDRPSFLEPTSGSASIVGAIKLENVDFLGAYAYRKQGNYHAGTNGPAADAVHVGPRTICGTYVCNDYPDYIENEGIANYRAGEEVLNTELETKTFLAKLTMRFGDGHSLKFGYTGYRGEAGDLLASRLTSDRGQAVQQDQTSGTKLDTFSTRYRWKPEEGGLIDLEANFWWTSLEMRNAARGGGAYSNPGAYGLPDNFRVGSDSTLWGADVKNKSSFDSRFGSWTFSYGLSYLSEETEPSPYTYELETWLDYRDAERQQAAGFAKVDWKPLEWLTINGGLRYEHYWSKDRNDPYLNRPSYTYDNKTNGDGWSPSVGIVIEPFHGAQLYATYSNVMRAPGLIEVASGFSMNVSPEVGPERASNWEFGANFTKRGLVGEDDQGMVKLGYFDWTIDDYIAREWQTVGGISSMHIHNLERAHFAGMELSGRYEWSGFTAELGANYYTDVEFCPTSDTCEDKSLYADYATNQVPPEYSISLSLSKTFFDDALTLGGRLLHVGPRAIEHGAATATGASNFITQVEWDPYTLVDAFAEYKVTDNLTAALRVENLTDQYYVDPLSLVQQPGPGRTFYASMTAKF